MNWLMLDGAVDLGLIFLASFRRRYIGNPTTTARKIIIKNVVIRPATSPTLVDEPLKSLLSLVLLSLFLSESLSRCFNTRFGGIGGITQIRKK
jgi:hypothetical protein